MNVFVERYILILEILAFLEVNVLGKVHIWLFAWSVQIISGLDNQNKFQMFILLRDGASFRRLASLIAF